MPFVIVGVVLLHVWALHIGGSNNPLGIDVQGPQDTLPFHPYYTVKDMLGLTVFLLAYVAVSFWAPNIFQHPDAFVEFDPLKTPPHIVPEWYFLPFYAILRSVTFDIGVPFTSIIIIPAKLGGVISMFGSVILLAFLPWLDTHPVRSARFRPVFRPLLLLFVLSVFVLGYVGAQTADAVWFHVGSFAVPMLYLGQLCTAYYFVFFLIILPILARKEKSKPLPASINEAVLKEREAH